MTLWPRLQHNALRAFMLVLLMSSVNVCFGPHHGVPSSAQTTVFGFLLMGPVPASVALGIRTGVSACGSQHPLNATACRALSCLLPVLSLGPAECHHCDKHRARTCQQSIPRATEMERWCINDAQKALRRCLAHTAGGGPSGIHMASGQYHWEQGTPWPLPYPRHVGARPEHGPLAPRFILTPLPRGCPVNRVHGRSTGASWSVYGSHALMFALLFCFARLLTSNRGGGGGVTWGRFSWGCEGTVVASRLLDKGGAGTRRGEGGGRSTRGAYKAGGWGRSTSKSNVLPKR